MSDYRYLIYRVDKGQSNPEFRNTLPDWLLQDSDDGGCYVVVDLDLELRRFYGEWARVDREPLNPSIGEG